MTLIPAQPLATGHTHTLSFAERRRWTRRYEQRLREQLLQAIAHVHQRPPTELSAHLESLLTLLHHAHRWPALHPLAVELIAALHPWPLRWLYWAAWEPEVRFAMQFYADQNQPDRQAEFLGHLAHILFNRGHLNKALATSQEALDLACAHDAVTPLASAGCVVVLTLLQQEHSDAARRRLDQLLVDVTRIESASPRAKTEALARLGLQALTFLRRENRLDEAVTQTRRIIAQLEALPITDEHLVAQAYLQRSTMFWAAGRYPEAVRDIQQAIGMFSTQGDKFAEADAQGNLGLIYYTMTKFDLAEERFRRVIALAERLHTYWHLTYAVDYLGAIYLLRGELDQATHYFERAIDLARSSGAIKDLHRIQSNRAVAWLYAGKYEAAIPALEAGLHFSEERQLSGAVLMNCICLSLCYLELEQRERALRLAQRAMDISQSLKNTTFQVLALRCWAEHHPEQRRTLLPQALSLARQEQRPLDEAACLLSLAELTPDAEERLTLWNQGVRILERIGATAWLADAAPHAPPRIIILV